MRILLVHNHYGAAAPSGENRVFALEKDLLQSNGYEVETFERHSDRLREKGITGAIAGGAMTPWNPFAARDIAATIKRFRPDIIHAHNTFPMLSPAIFPAARGTARVLTLHNYRLVCPAAIAMRNGTPCTACIDGKTVLPALRHGCYRSSRLATAPLAANVALHRWRGTWQHDVEAFIALSAFQRDLMVRAGLPADKVFIKPNFYPGTPVRTPYAARPDRVVFAGRLCAEKGAADLVDAWLMWGPDAPELRLIGDGVLRDALAEKASQAANITFLGQVDPQTAEQEIGNARLLVVPSRWFEGFPMVLREAFALGTPVAVSNQGPLADIASNADGVVFHPNDPADLLAKLRNRWNDRDRLTAMAKASVAAFKTEYSENRNLELLRMIYDQALIASKEAAQR